MIDVERFKITIENPKGSYASFYIEDDPAWRDYPLKGVTYPVDYGFINGYIGEDADGLDVFVGSGSLNGFIKVRRLDVPEETKTFIGITEDELNQILKAFGPVLIDHWIFDDQQFLYEIEKFKK